VTEFELADNSLVMERGKRMDYARDGAGRLLAGRGLLDLDATVAAYTAAYDLTVRQRQVLRLLFMGRPTLGIARELGIKLRSVKSHIELLYPKLGVHSRAELMASLFGERR
jgi:DNA-binding NarL/FixJ family response regulator